VSFFKVLGHHDSVANLS